MFDPQKLLDQFMGGGARPGQDHGVPGQGGSGFSPDMLKGLAGGAAAGGLVSILLGSKGGKKLDRLLEKAKATLRALHVELHEESVERGSPIHMPADSMATAVGLVAKDDAAAE